MQLKYRLVQKKFRELKDKIDIPSFQRGLVWGENKKKEFIKTLKAGLPIGVLLLSEPQNGKYHVIDGLQRFTTMLDYSRDYFSYIDSDEITDSDVISIILASPQAKEWYDLRPEKDKALVKDKIRKIIVKNISAGQNKNLNQISKNTCDQLCNDVHELEEKDKWDIYDAVFVIVQRFSEAAKIEDIELPLIIFDGNQEELANVFQKLNQEGVRLSKYDVFAATWATHIVNVKGDDEFIRRITKKYDKAQEDSGLEISNYDPDQMIKTGDLTAFEYAFALGKELIDKCEILFNAKKDDSKVESIGFIILAELLGLSYQEMGRLATELKKYDKLDFIKLKDAIVETAKSVQTALGDYIVAPVGQNKKKYSLTCHSELQLASYIIVLFKLRYEITIQKGLEDKGNKAKEIKEIKKYLYRHYIYDILRGYWSGSGDSKLEEIIAEPTTCRYVKDVNKESFEQVISEWLTTSNKKNNVTSVSMETKLFLNYMLRMFGNPYEVSKMDYDIEHCVPKKVLQEFIVKKNVAVPISAACNLVYIPKAENRGKGDKTYYQKQKGDSSTYTLNSEALEALNYPSKEELAFVNSVSTITAANYFAFLENREKYITHRMISKLYE